MVVGSAGLRVLVPKRESLVGSYRDDVLPVFHKRVDVQHFVQIGNDAGEFPGPGIELEHSPVPGSQPQIVVGVFTDAEYVRNRTVRPEGSEAPVDLVIMHETAARTPDSSPHVAVTVGIYLRDIQHFIPLEGLGHDAEAEVLTFKAYDSVGKGGEPYAAVLVLGDAQDIGTECSTFGVTDFEHTELTRVTRLVKKSAARTHPQCSPAVGQKRGDILVIYRQQFLRKIQDRLEGLAVIAVETVLGTHPEETVHIEGNGLHGVVREAVADGEIPEICLCGEQLRDGYEYGG